MKRLIHFFFFVFFLGFFSLNVKADQRVEQEIQYRCDNAGEVFMVWGINGWMLPASELLPANSFFKDNLVYTPLKKTGADFVAQLSLPAGTTIDYVFWITKGIQNAGTDIWDTNSPDKDFHTVCTSGDPVLINATVKIRPAEELSVLDFAFPVFLIVLLATAILFFVTRKSQTVFSPAKKTVVRLVAIGLAVYVFLLLIRPSVLGMSWEIYLHPLTHFGDMISASLYDLFLVMALLAVFLAAAFVTRRHARLNNKLPWLFGIVGVFCVLAAVLNIKIVQMLGRPFNYQWLYYSDFMRSADSRVALSANVTFSYVASIVTLCAALVLFTRFLFIVLYYSWDKLKLRKVTLVLVFVFLSGVVAYSNKTIHEKKWDYEKLANPVTAFLESVNPFTAQPELFTMAVNDTLNDFNHPGKKSLQPLPSSAIKNVIVFVMESTPAEYVEVYGGKYPVTPSLKEHSAHAVIFNNTYAHAPATNLSMVSILGSIYPWLSYNSFTQEHPDLDIPTINSELKRAGYRSGFFNSADNRFQKADEFLRFHQFDSVSDCHSNTCSDSKFSIDSNWEFMDGKNDACTAREIGNWIKEEPGKPFFAVMWTYQTHYPYFFEGEEEKFSEDPFFNRYLNALKHSDKVFSSLMTALKENNLDDSTLVVVVGDHGEAFGRHDQITHGRKIYEENLHVPFMLIHPSFNSTRNDQVIGLVDIAPTVMHLLGREAPESWQGQSAFSQDRRNRVYFFAPWSDFLFGYRDGNMKYIYNATKNQNEIYDLNTDPLESQNLAQKYPEKIAVSHQRLAAWAQYVNNKTDNLIQQKAEGPGSNVLASSK